jgi:hypothetical protein
MAESVGFSLPQDRPFRILPEIAGFSQNQWLVVESSWAEFGVRNIGSGELIYIPKSYFRACSDDVATLVRPLVYRSGLLVPVKTSNWSVPTAGPSADLNPDETSIQTGFSAPVHPTDRMAKRAVWFGVSALVALLIGGMSAYYWQRTHRSYRAVLQMSPGLSASSKYADVIRTFGKPNSDTWTSTSNAVQFRVLDYPDQQLRAILFGPDRKSMFYVGLLDKDGRVLHTVKVDGKNNSAALLRLFVQNSSPQKND